MKHTVHVTVTYAVEVDSDKIKKEFGRRDRRTILEYAKNNYNPKMPLMYQLRYSKAIRL
jgi:hypothetical protein